MTEEAQRRLEEIRQELRLAAEAISANHDSFACCERLVDALAALIRFLEVAVNNQT
jgi:hypothetical protein